MEPGFKPGISDCRAHVFPLTSWKGLPWISPWNACPPPSLLAYLWARGGRSSVPSLTLLTVHLGSLKVLEIQLRGHDYTLLKTFRMPLPYRLEPHFLSLATRT